MNTKFRKIKNEILELSLSDGKKHKKKIDELFTMLSDVQNKKSFLIEVEDIRLMDENKLNETFDNLKHYISQIGNQAIELDNKLLNNTCVAILKTMKIYNEIIKG